MENTLNGTIASSAAQVSKDAAKISMEAAAVAAKAKYNDVKNQTKEALKNFTSDTLDNIATTAGEIAAAAKKKAADLAN